MTRAALGERDYLHRDPAERAGDRADQNDRREERAQEADHGVEDLSSAEGRAVQRDLVRDAVDADDAGDEDAACDGRDGHHHGVGQEIEEVQKLHADHGDICQRAVAQAGEASEENHRDAHDARGLLTAPVQLILQGRDGTFRQRDGARQRGEQDQQEERDADHRAEAHGIEDLRDGDEHQRGASLQRAGIAAGEGEHRGDDHQARHDGDGRVEDLDIAGGAFDRDVLFHVGTERDENAHGDGQGIKHLPHGGDDRHPGEVVNQVN